MLDLLVFCQVFREVAGGVFCFLGWHTEKPNLKMLQLVTIRSTGVEKL